MHILVQMIIFCLLLLASGSCPDNEVQVGVAVVYMVDDVVVDDLRLRTKQTYCADGPCYEVEQCSVTGGQEVEVVINNATMLVEHSQECDCDITSCNGDQTYCQYHNCNIESPCYCTLIRVQDHQEIFYNGIWQPYIKTNVPVCQPEVNLPLDPFTLKPISLTKRSLDNPIERELWLRRAYDTLSILWDQPKLRIKMAYVTVHLGCKELTQTHVCGSICDFVVDNELLREPELCVKVENGTTVVLDTKIGVTPEVWCMMPDCIFCSRFQDAFSCYQSTQQVAIILGATGVALSVVLIIIQFLFWLAGKLPQQTLNLSLTKKEVMTACIMCLMICAESQPSCTGGLLLDSKDTVCFMDGANQHCNISLSAISTLRFPGDALCVAVNDDGGSLLGTLRIAYLRAALDTSLTLQYWTSNWALEEISDKWCRTTAQCNSAKNCQTIISSPNAGGGIPGSPIVLQRPGVTTCMNLCGCAGCGCVNCASACGYSRWGMDPIPSTVPIFSPAVAQVITDLEVNWGPVDGPPINQIFSIVGSPVTAGPFTVGLEGVFNAPDVDFADWKILGCGLNCMKFVKASAQNVPVKGTIGDVQGASSLSFTNPTFNSFLYDTSICTGYPQGDAVGYVCSKAGLLQADGYQAFTDVVPIEILGLQCRVGPSQNLECDIPNAPPVLVSFVTSTNLTLVREVTIICPVGEFIAFSGCYGCDQGANMTLKLKSVCLPGTESVSIDFGLMTDNTVSMTLQDEIFTLRFTTNLAQIDGTISIGSADPTRVLKLRVTGTLLDPVSYIQQVRNQQSVNGTTFSDWFNTLDWSQRTGTLIGIILGSVLGMVALGLLIWLVIVIIQRSSSPYAMI